MHKKIISDYYDYTLPFYRIFWHKNSDSYALHYGFWEKDTKDLNEALVNTNRFLAKKATITSSDIVLDTGCGIGGSAIWLAKNFQVHVVGITISKKQIDKAKELAKKHNLTTLTNFYVMDYLKTSFGPNSFDVVWAIESVCHAQGKHVFLKEAYRLLKDRGRIILADGFLKREPKNNRENHILKTVTEGLALPNLASIHDFTKAMKEVGFCSITFWDKTKEIMPSSKKLSDMCTIGYPLARITEKLRLTSPILTKNNRAGISQYTALQIGLGAYGVFYGQK